MPNTAIEASSLSGGAADAPLRLAGLRRVLRVVAWLVILASALITLRALPSAQVLDLVQRQVGTLGPWGPIAFGAAYFLAALLFVPGSALTLAAGAIFGLAGGFATVSVASTAAAGASFLIARYLARARVRKMADTNRTFGAIDAAIAQGGWRIIALLRLSPAVPFSLGNYLYGLTPVRFWPYLLASWIAMMPGTFLYVYLGVAGKTAAAAGGGGKSPWQFVLLGAGLLATLVVSIYVTRLARAALKQTALQQPEPSSTPGEHPAPPAKSGPKPVGKLIAAAVLLAAVAAGAQASKTRLRGMFGPPRATLQEAYADAPAGGVFDHSAFDALLRAHVSADGGFVDYDGLRGDAPALDAYIAALGEADLEALGRDERLALLVNAYNAFTLRLILDHYPIDSIKDIPAEQRWDAKRWALGAGVYSLNQIEHELIRPRFAEPRVHFALVCAAIGCPPLRAGAYTGAGIEAQLTEQARYVHANPRWFRLDTDNGKLLLTSLYDWYGGDFEQMASSIVAYAAQYSPELVRFINAGNEPRVEFLEYSWKLNSASNRALADEQ